MDKDLRQKWLLTGTELSFNSTVIKVAREAQTFTSKKHDDKRVSGNSYMTGQI